MLRRKALLASQVGSRAMELEFHLTEDVDTYPWTDCLSRTT